MEVEVCCNLMVPDAASDVEGAYRRHMRAAVEADRSHHHIAGVDIVGVEELHILLRRIEVVEGGILEEGIAAVVDNHCCIAVAEDSRPDYGNFVLESPT